MASIRQPICLACENSQQCRDKRRSAFQDGVTRWHAKDFGDEAEGSP